MRKIFFVFLLLLSFNAKTQISVFSNFENGNVEIVEIKTDSNYVCIRPSLINDKNSTRCWFNFGITGFDTSRTLIIEYKFISSVMAPENPVFSTNQKNWIRTKAVTTNNFSKKVEIEVKSDTIFFATGYPYNYSRLLFFVDSISNNKFIDTMTLTQSEAGNRVPMFIISDKKEKPTDLVWIICRQHAFEATSNYTIEGIVNFLSSDEKLAKQFRKNTIVYVVPMMDVDNVISGASGRMQKPVDFNRDWSKNPYWQAVKKTQEFVQQTAEIYNFRIFFDVHSTFPGTTSSRFGIFNEYEKTKPEYDNLRNYLKIYKKITGYKLEEIPGNMNEYFADAFYSGIRSPFIRTTDFCTTIECDWTTNQNGNPLTIKELRYIGENMSKALCEYLK